MPKHLANQSFHIIMNIFAQLHLVSPAKPSKHYVSLHFSSIVTLLLEAASGSASCNDKLQRQVACV
ncbi:hypothetical protein B2J67_16605 [Vibrio cholerae]|nr:hypothetical protein B2J67_16605 [Vibrio cholerae]CSI52474.1 Uncharacterised protein [Vibrio cholerae]